jgi:hypothetical protein
LGIAWRSVCCRAIGQLLAQALLAFLTLLAFLALAPALHALHALLALALQARASHPRST